MTRLRESRLWIGVSGDNRNETCEMEIKSLRSRRLCVLCVFVGLIRHTQQIRELSVFNGAKENAEDAETQRVECRTLPNHVSRARSARPFGNEFRV